MTEEHKRKISEATKGKNKGKVPWMKGKQHTEEAKLKNKLAHLGKVSPMKGRHHSEESKEKNRQTKLKQIDDCRRWGILGCLKFQNSKEPTSIERKVYEFLKLIGIEFEKQKLIDNRFTVDAFVPHLNLIIECDGIYWHSLKNNAARDKYKDKYLSKLGYKIIRLTEEEINNGNFKKSLLTITVN